MIAYKAKPVVAGVLALASVIMVQTRADAQGASAAMRQACHADYQQFCSGVMPGGGRIAACLKSHASELSSGCQQALEKAASGAPKMRDDAPGHFEHAVTDTIRI
jgi:Cysteine rich repeat